MKVKGKNLNLTALLMLATFVAVILLLAYYGLDHMVRVQALQTAMDIFAMSLGLILFCLNINKGNEMNRQGICFLVLEVVVFFGLSVDAADWIVGEHANTRNLSIVLETLLFASNPLGAYAFFNYMLECINVKKTGAIKKLYLAMKIGLVASILMCVINLFYPIYFYYDMAGVYHRGSFYHLSNVYAYLCGTTTLIFLILHRKRLYIYQLLFLMSFTLAPVIALIINILFYGLTPVFSVMMVIMTSLYLILNVERSREQFVLGSELSMAAQIQEAMLPELNSEITDTKEYDLYATMNPAKVVGGDFYDFFMLDDNRLALVMADVSDKGIGSALFMAVSKAMLKMRSQAGGSPGEVLSDVNIRLAQDNKLNMFVTVWLGYLDLTTGHLVACNGGHGYPALLLKEKEPGEPEGYVIKKTNHGPMVGIFEGSKYPETEFTMQPGDRLFLYTDGVNEAEKSDGEQFGFDRLLEVLNGNLNGSSETVCRYVKDAVRAFEGEGQQFDDITMLALTFRGYDEKH